LVVNILGAHLNPSLKIKDFPHLALCPVHVLKLRQIFQTQGINEILLLSKPLSRA